VALFGNACQQNDFQAPGFIQSSVRLLRGTREVGLLLHTERFVAGFVRLLDSPGIYNRELLKAGQ